MIIENDDIHIRHIVAVPSAQRSKSGKEFLPIVLMCLAIVHGGANAGYM